MIFIVLVQLNIEGDWISPILKGILVGINSVMPLVVFEMLLDVSGIMGLSSIAIGCVEVGICDDNNDL